jgi:TRAP-type C4-dicarboxylate transport system permease large subunit
MIVLSTAVVIPMVQQAGIDLLWFGIFLTIMVEVAQITPPVGFNLFVVQGITGQNIFYIAKAALPFFVLMLVMIALLIAFPEMATWLPTTMKSPA